jgi:hypothetical protein
MSTLLPTNLLVTCTLMFVGALGAGALPMLFNMGKEWVSWVRSKHTFTKHRDRGLCVVP